MSKEPDPANRISYLDVDQASYITFGAVLKSLSCDTIQHIISVHSLISRKVSRPSPNDSAKIPKHFVLAKSDIVMGIIVGQLVYPHSNSIRLTLEEITVNGTKGLKFFLTLYANLFEEWKDSQVLKTALKSGKALLLIQNIPFQFKGDDVHFNLTSMKNNPSVKVKNYFSSFSEANSERYAYLSLLDAAESLNKKCNIYAVVHSILKEPSSVSTGKGHGMFLIVDPSCYEQMVKKRDYRVHIFTSSLEVFPKINVGDIIRLHRVVTEIRPKDGLSDFRVFREGDLVIFPWNDQEKPRCLANRFTYTEWDIAEVKRLKAWSLERYQTKTTTGTETKIITLSDIKAEESFNLPCRLVEFFDEGQGIALWVEDGTQCPLYTCSDAYIQPFDSQATQDICNECTRICIRCSKRLLAGLKLESQMLLYLREVEPTIQNCQPEDTFFITQFEVKGAVEVLPQNTRYHKSLLQRLEKLSPNNHQDALNRQQLRSRESIEEPLSKNQSEVESAVMRRTSDKVQVAKPAVRDQLVDDLPSCSIENPKLQDNAVALFKDKLVSSGETSTENAMKEIPSDFFEPSPPNLQLVREDLMRESRRLHLLVHPDNDDYDMPVHSQFVSRPSAKSQNLASLEDMTFSQVVASTQKQPYCDSEESSDSDELSKSLGVSHGQRIFSSGSEDESTSKNTKGKRGRRDASPVGVRQSDCSPSQTKSSSPHPVFRAVSEVLEIKTNHFTKSDECSSNEENQLNVSINSPLFRPRPGDGDEKIEAEFAPNVTKDSCHRGTRTLRNAVTEIVSSDCDDQREEIVLTVRGDGNSNNRALESKLIALSSSSKKHNADLIGEPPNKSIRLHHGDKFSSQNTIFETIHEGSQESDKESIIMFDPYSQMDLEKVFCAVEEAGPLEKYVDVLGDENFLEPGCHFRIMTRVNELFSDSSESDHSRLENLLVAFCPECKHMFEYKHFINSISERMGHVRNPRRIPDGESPPEVYLPDSAINYLCSKEEHDRNMEALAENMYANFDAYESDENVFMDQSYVFICPLCKSFGIPHSLCQLEPSFFFFLHLTQESDDSKCFHAMASGVHAEFFLGTKADHVLRSTEVWKRAENRIKKLLEYQRPLTLNLHKSSDEYNEYNLERTYVVYSNNHLLPW